MVQPKEIPLDINTVEIPEEVFLSNIATSIKDMCTNFHKEIPRPFKAFVKKHYQDMAGYGWEANLLSAADKMSDELLSQWFKIMPSSFARANMRVIMKERGLLPK